MEITLKNYDLEITIKKDAEDITIGEWFEYFNSGLIGLTFQQSTINQFIIEYAEELKENQKD